MSKGSQWSKVPGVSACMQCWLWRPRWVLKNLCCDDRGGSSRTCAVITGQGAALRRSGCWRDVKPRLLVGAAAVSRLPLATGPLACCAASDIAVQLQVMSPPSQVWHETVWHEFNLLSFCLHPGTSSAAAMLNSTSGWRRTSGDNPKKVNPPSVMMVRTPAQFTLIVSCNL